ncbi:MAG: HD domain-containing protein [Desulfobulbaceae bacterium]|nr:HD domain-containing protein [Desulfobulbaceae bacterium]
MLDNIKAHSIIVCRVAELISQAYIQRGDPLNLDLVIASSLLHDIAKTPCLNGGCDHASVGEEICRKHEFDEVADIVAEHVLIKSNGRGDITEKEIVYYADKRVNHDKVVSLDDRLAYILERYGSSSKYRYESIMENFKKCQQMEKRIFTGLEFAPPDVGALILSQKGWSA